MRYRISYSDRFSDEKYTYRLVKMPYDIAKLIPKGRVLEETEWRAFGVQLSRGWEHYALHRPEPHVLMMRRPYDAENPGEEGWKGEKVTPSESKCLDPYEGVSEYINKWPLFRPCEKIVIKPAFRKITEEWLWEIFESHRGKIDELEIMGTALYIFHKTYPEDCQRAKIQLRAITAYMIAKKFHDDHSDFSPSDAEYLTDNTYTVPEIILAEEEILETIDFGVAKTTYITVAFAFFKETVDSYKKIFLRTAIAFSMTDMVHTQNHLKLGTALAYFVRALSNDSQRLKPLCRNFSLRFGKMKRFCLRMLVELKGVWKESEKNYSTVRKASDKLSAPITVEDLEKIEKKLRCEIYP